MELISQQTQKLLLDKNHDKQIQGAAELDNAVQMILRGHNEQAVRKLVMGFQVWISNNQQRRAGMYALYVIANVLMREEKTVLAQSLVVEMTQPALDQMGNPSDSVRLAAIECLIYLCRALQGIILVNFKDIFDTMLVHIDDDNEQIQMAVFHLDSNLKQIVNSIGQEKKYLNIEKFLPTLNKMSRLKTIQQRSLLLTWIKCLHSIPSVDMFMYLPQILEGLFKMLEDNAKEIRTSTGFIIDEFFKEIEYYRKEVLSELEQRVTEQILVVLIQVCIKGNNLARLSAVLWIFEYLRIYQSQLDDENPKQSKTRHQWSLCVPQAPSDFSQMIRTHQEREQDPPLKHIIVPKMLQILEPILNLLSHEEEEICKAAQKTNELLQRIVERERRINKSSIEFLNLVMVVKDLIKQPDATAKQALIWLNSLLRIYSSKLIPQMDTILPRLIDRMNEADGPVMDQVMEVIGTISRQDQYFDLVIERMIYVLTTNKVFNVIAFSQVILRNKCDFIITKLCSSTSDSEKVYETFCTKLLNMRVDNEFVTQLVESLEYVLITTKVHYGKLLMIRNSTISGSF